MNALLRISAPCVLVITLAGCGGDGTPGAMANGSSGSTGGTTTTTTAKLDVTPCFNQQVIPGRTLAAIAVPDVVTLDLTKPSGFPNGRQLQDQVIDLELAALLLDLKSHAVTTFASIPLNPGSNDKPFLGTFPFLSDAWGGAPAQAGGAGFVFRAEAPSAYKRVDRMGEPAIATVLVDSGHKSAYNDDSPVDDATGKWVATFKTNLEVLAEELDPQLASLGFKSCAVPVTGSSVP